MAEVQWGKCKVRELEVERCWMRKLRCCYCSGKSSRAGVGQQQRHAHLRRRYMIIESLNPRSCIGFRTVAVVYIRIIYAYMS
jgi:hypothetical protein